MANHEAAEIFFSLMVSETYQFLTDCFLLAHEGLMENPEDLYVNHMISPILLPL